MKFVAAVLLLLFSVLVATPAPADAQGGGVRLNELQSANQTTLTTAAGATPDWIEVFNDSAASVDLGGWGLSDTRGQPFKWQFPAGTSLAPGAMLVVFASGDDVAINGELHTNFSLAADGEILSLVDSSGTLISSFDPLPALFPDDSYGFTPNGSLAIYTTPTPGAPNGSSSSAGILGDPAVLPERGFLTSATQVTMSHPDQQATLRYTLDGTAPTATTGTVYSGPITVSSSTSLRVAAYRDGWLTGRPVTHTYIFANQEPSEVTATVASLPTISLVTTADINIADPDRSAVSVEWIDPDGGQGFQVDAGIDVVGNTSAERYAKKSWRLYFGNEWGESRLDFPVFDGFPSEAAVAPTDSFKRLTLRAGGHDSTFYDGFGRRFEQLQTYLKNRWGDETMLELGHVDTHGRWVNVFQDGEYWGLYQLREHFDDHFMAEYFGGDNSSYMGINGGEYANGTDGGAWDAAVADADSWSAWSSHVDPIHYMDWMLLNEYQGNFWDLHETNNWRGAGPSVAGGPPGFIFHGSDQDVTLTFIDVSLPNAHDPASIFTGPASSWENLLAERDPEFLILLNDRVEELLRGDGELTPAAAIERWDRLAAQIEVPVQAELPRWAPFMVPGDVAGPLTYPQWQADVATVRNVVMPAQTQFVLDHLAEVISPIQAPVIGDSSVPAGSFVPVDNPNGAGEVFITTDETDPRSAGGAVAPTAVAATNVLVDRAMTVTARVRLNGEWGPFVQVDLIPAADPNTTTRVLLNEYNAVSSSSFLSDNGADVALGRVLGNGGDWFELVVLEDGLDMRGWTLQVWNRDLGVTAVDAELTLTNDSVLENLRAGTLITVSEAIADDVSFDPLGGDWHLNLQANDADQGAFFTAASQSNFAVNASNTQVVILDDIGRPATVAMGEGLAPQAAVNDTEVFKLEGTPDVSIEPTSTLFADGTSSSWGQPNVWGGGVNVQDLSGLRYIYGDTNCSGTITIADAVVISQALVGLRTDSNGCSTMTNPTAQINMVAADANRDGNITIADAVLVAQCTALLTNSLCS